MERIKQYYRLCLIKSEEDKPTPLYNQLDEKVVVSVMGQNHIVMFLKEDKKGYTLKETVIGGGKSRKKMMNNDEPILIL